MCQAQGIYLKSGPQMPPAPVEHIGPRGKQMKNHLGKASNCHERCEEKAGKIMNDYSRELCLCVREAERRVCVELGLLICKDQPYAPVNLAEFEMQLSHIYKDRQHRAEVKDRRPGPGLPGVNPGSYLHCMLS